MIQLALYVTAGILVVLIPVVLCAKYLEWRSWDTDRRVQRLRDRRQMHSKPVEITTQWEYRGYRP